MFIFIYTEMIFQIPDIMHYFFDKILFYLFNPFILTMAWEELGKSFHTSGSEMFHNEHHLRKYLALEIPPL